jgi:hypothetical protein
MGRLLEIVRETERTMLSVLAPSFVPLSAPAVLPIAVLPVRAEPQFDQAASDVLGILVQADQPVPHSRIVAALVAKGYTKVEACQAIARCQKRRWVEHNLTTGYVLP